MGPKDPRTGFVSHCDDNTYLFHQKWISINNIHDEETGLKRIDEKFLEMSQSVFEEEISPESQDLFSDFDFDSPMEVNDAGIANTSPIDNIGQDSTNRVPDWRGVGMDRILQGSGIYERQELPPICLSTRHTLSIMLPLPSTGPPKPYPVHTVDKWSQNYVRMPHSVHNLYSVNNEESGNQCRKRWEMIQEALLQNFISSQQLEVAILSYNQAYATRWNFEALHHFFSKTIDEDDRKMFFENLLPKMVQLALQLPSLVTGPIRLLKRHENSSLSLSQLQVASLLANAFFCTFPRRNSTGSQSEYGFYPQINFNSLFGAWRHKKNYTGSLMEKYKCLFHYFKRVTTKAPEGVITIERRYLPKQDCPKWDEIHEKLPPLHIASKGMIEDAAGFLQVDFANRFLGGGVLRSGCVQEEIRFVISPELIATMLVTEAMDDTEAVIVTGAETYSTYEGYSTTFKWTGDFIDTTPRDSSGRRMTSIVAIDALRFTQPAVQYNSYNITRELNKAYVGFMGSKDHQGPFPAIATGNWGCGAYRGNPKLKALLQLLAASVSRRSLVYYTFGDTVLRDEIAKMYSTLVEHDLDVARLFQLILQYDTRSSKKSLDFYEYLNQRINRVEENQSTSINEKVFCKNKQPSLSKQSNKRYFYPSSKKEEEHLDQEMMENFITNYSKNVKKSNNSHDEKKEEEKITPFPRRKHISLAELFREEEEALNNDVSNTGVSTLNSLTKFEIVNEAEDKHDTSISISPEKKVVETLPCTIQPIQPIQQKMVQKKISDFFSRT